MQGVVNEIVVQNPEHQVIASLQENINTSISQMQKLKEEQKKLKEMIDSTLLNDSVYQEHNKTVKEATRVLRNTKFSLFQVQSTKELIEKKKDISGQIKDLKNALSDYLLEYTRIAHVEQLELFTGDEVQIVKTAKVIKLSKFKK